MRHHHPGIRHGQRGLTLIEVLVTLFVLTSGILATLAVFSEMGRATHSAQRKAVMTSYAQREMEILRILPYSQIGLSAAVSSEAATKAPLTGTPAAGEPPVCCTGVIAPGPEKFSVQGVSGTLYRYVTWRAQGCPLVKTKIATAIGADTGRSASSVEAELADLCPGSEQTKRITIVVRSNDEKERGGVVRLSTVASDPDTSPLATTGSTGLKVSTQSLTRSSTSGATTGAAAQTYASVTSQDFHLTDTLCSSASRQAPGSSHASHDTSRAANSCAGADPPDLMWPTAPTGSVTAPLPDLSNEVTRASVGGLALTRDDRGNSCSSELGYATDPTTIARRKRSLHTWATPAPTGNYETPATGGRATLTFWTQTTNATEAPGRLCATIWRGTTGEVLGTTDYQLPTWPAAPVQLAISIDLARAVIPAGERLMLTLRTPETSGADLLLLYDHAGYASSLSLTFVQGRELTR